jgi:hypothetical protein
MSLLTYVPERDMFFLILRSGSGEGGASTRGTGSPTGGGCYLNGQPDDCFRMYGFRFDGSIITTGGGPAPPPGTSGDTTPPTAAIQAPTGGTVSGNVAVQVTANDDVGVTRVELYANGVLVGADNAAPYAFSWNSATVSNGSVQLLVRAHDAAGNVGTSSVVTVVASNAGTTADTIAPIVAITSPAGGVVSGAVTVNVSATDNMGVARVELYVNGAQIGTTGIAPYAFVWNSASAANGSAQLLAKAYDAAGNVGTSSAVAVNVSNADAPPSTDTASPSVTIDPLVSTVVSGILPVRLSASDNVGVAQVDLYADGGLVGSATSAPYRVDWDTTPLPSGPVSLTAVARDAAGNSATSAAVAVTVDNATANYGGIWWAAPPGSESGWGINFAHQGDVIFATWFTYNSRGRAWWLSMTASKIADNAYAGTLYETNGPPFSFVPFSPKAVTLNAVGTGTLSFSGDEEGTFEYVVNGVSQKKSITRQEFGPMPVCVYGGVQDITSADNYQDLWWAEPDGSEAGWGVNLAHQGDTIFATWFTYDVDGAPLWLSSVAPLRSPNTYEGGLVQTAGPAFSETSFDPSKVTRNTVGSATFKFNNGNAAKFTFKVNGITQTKSIKRQVFRAPGTACFDH